MTGAPGERVALGSAIFALIEPHPGQARAFNRWYERDHLYAVGAMAPWTLAAARFVATRPLKALRVPRPSPFCDPVEAGSYLSAIWVQAGRLGEQQAWVLEQMEVLRQQGRLFAGRTHVSTHRYALESVVHRDADGVPPELALDHRYPGLVCTWVERSPGVPLDALRQWLLDRYWTPRLAGSPVALVLAFSLLPKPAGWPDDIPEPPGLGERLLLVHFLEEVPTACWERCFTPLAADLVASKQGRLLLAAPFVPTVPGSDVFTDAL